MVAISILCKLSLALAFRIKSLLEYSTIHSNTNLHLKVACCAKNEWITNRVAQLFSEYTPMALHMLYIICLIRGSVLWTGATVPVLALLCLMALEAGARELFEAVAALRGQFTHGFLHRQVPATQTLTDLTAAVGTRGLLLFETRISKQVDEAACAHQVPICTLWNESTHLHRAETFSQSVFTLNTMYMFFSRSVFLINVLFLLWWNFLIFPKKTQSSSFLNDLRRNKEPQFCNICTTAWM